MEPESTMGSRENSRRPPPGRVVSLVPSLTETLFALGLGDRVVGVTDYCVHPAAEVEHRRRVGGTKNPDLEAILGLRPDLVFLNAEENLRDHAEKLEKKVPVHVSMPRTVDETIQHVLDLGALFDVADRAETLCRRIRDARDSIRCQPPAARPRVLYLIWWNPVMTVNRDTYLHDMIDCAGGINAFADHEARYPTVTWDEIRNAGVDLILLSSEPYAFGEREQAKILERMEIPADRIRFVDGEFASWHGVRTAPGILHLADVLQEG